MSDENTSAEEQNRTNHDELIQARRAIALGLDVKAFVRTDLGRAFVDRCNTMRQTALEELADADPEDPKAIRRLQNTAQCAGLLLTWLEEIENEGEQAERIYEAAG